LISRSFSAIAKGYPRFNPQDCFAQQRTLPEVG
jgi:hypothetical protein